MNDSNYKINENMICCGESKSVNSAPEESLTKMLDEAAGLATDALLVARKINHHLFGIGEPQNEEKCNPECFRDVLNYTGKRLSELCKELARITDRLGV